MATKITVESNTDDLYHPQYDRDSILAKFKPRDQWEIPYKNPDCDFCKKAHEVPCGDLLLAFFEAQYDAHHNFVGSDDEFEFISKDMFKAEREAYAKCALQPETQKWWDEHNKTALADHKDLISKSEQRIADLRKAAAEGDKGDEAVESLIKEEEGELRKLWEEMREIEESCE